MRGLDPRVIRAMEVEPSAVSDTTQRQARRNRAWAAAVSPPSPRRHVGARWRRTNQPLVALIRMIGADDAAAFRLLAASLEFATARSAHGATRQAAREYYLDAAAH